MLFVAFAVGFLFYFSGTKNFRYTYSEQQPWTTALEHQIRLWFGVPKMPESGIGTVSWLQLLMFCSVLLGDRWRGLCPVGATLLGGAGVFSLRFHYWGHWYTHKHTHGTLGMESYHLRWVQGDKNACIVSHRDCPSSSVALILFTVLMTEEATLLLSSICRSSPLIRDGTQNQTLLCHLIRGSWVCVCVCGNRREYISVN